MLSIPGECPPNGHSYRKGQLPTGYPGAGGYSQYNYKQEVIKYLRSGYIVDEEVEAAEIINIDVIEKVDQLMEEAEEDGMEYAVLQLSRLKEHIISLSQ
jgi:hypothetical protein